MFVRPGRSVWELAGLLNRTIHHGECGVVARVGRFAICLEPRQIVDRHGAKVFCCHHVLPIIPSMGLLAVA